MRVSLPTLDDAMKRSFEDILRSGSTITGAKRGTIRELIGVQIEIQKPRARISRYESRSTLFVCLGELLWYLSKSKDVAFMQYYLPSYDEFVEVDEAGDVLEAYGPRLFDWDGVDQIKTIIDLLRDRPASKKAVVQLFDRNDLGPTRKDAPCTCLLQYFVREGAVEAITMMRSNDAVLGLPHDVFTFTFLQEVVARSVGAEMGVYRHWVGSLHVYEKSEDTARKVIDEGWQQSMGVEMPAMPVGDPWPYIDILIKAEKAYRVDGHTEPWEKSGSEYWDGFLWLLEMKRHLNDEDLGRAKRTWDARPVKTFDDFVRKKVRALEESLSK